MRARYCRYGELGERTGAIGDGVDTLGDAILKSMDTVLHRLRPVRPRPVSSELSVGRNRPADSRLYRATD